MRGDDRRAYDRGTTVFSPDGRLYQVEYAQRAVAQGAPAVGVAGADAVVLAGLVEDRSPLVDRREPAKLSGVEGSIGVASAGHAADARQLVDLARRTAAAERRRYGEAAAVATLARTLGDHVQEDTQRGGTRPYGTALLLAGVGDRPELLEVDPSGATERWRADAVGRGADDALAHLEGAYEPGLDADAALSLSLDALAAAVDDLDPADVEAATVDAAGDGTLSQDRIAAAS